MPERILRVLTRKFQFAWIWGRKASGTCMTLASALVALSVFYAGFAHARVIYSWTKTIGSIAEDEGFSVTVDKSGNVYLTGYFSGTADFDPGAGTEYHTFNGQADIFLTKINADGTYGWTKTMGGPGFDIVLSVNVDSNCNVYLTGSFMDTVDFDPGAGTDYHSSAGSSDIFLTRINSDGTYAWTKTMGGPSEDRGLSVVVDGSGAVYVAGRFSDTVDFNPDPNITDSYTSGASLNVFLTKFNPDGTYAWTKAIGGPGSFDQVSIVANSIGNIYLTGLFSGTADFDPDPNITDSHASVGSCDIFLTKINPDGTYGWTKTMGGPGIDYASSGTVDSIGNIYLTGCFYDTADFDPDPNTVDSHTSAGLSDIFLTRINSDGTYGWTKTMGGANRNMSNSVTVDSSGNIYFAGFFYEHTDFDPDPNTTDHHSSAGLADIFLTKINSDGTYGWTKTIGGSGDDLVESGTSDSIGNIFLTGDFTGTADFDPNEGITDNHTSAGASDIFLTKFIMVSTPEDPADSDDGGCFIDTAAFGSNFDSQVKVLRILGD